MCDVSDWWMGATPVLQSNVGNSSTSCLWLYSTESHGELPCAWERIVGDNTGTQEMVFWIFWVFRFMFILIIDFRKIWHPEESFSSTIALAGVHVTVQHDDLPTSWQRQHHCRHSIMSGTKCFPWWATRIVFTVFHLVATPSYHPCGCHTVNCYWSLCPWTIHAGYETDEFCLKTVILSGLFLVSLWPMDWFMLVTGLLVPRQGT